LEVRWDKEGAVDYTFFYGNKSEYHQLGTGFCRYQRIISAIKTAEFGSNKLQYMVLREHCCDITVLNVHAPTVDKRDGSRYNFY
jgi:hypothetical protein